MASYSGTRWQPGDAILTREVHHGQVWLATSEYVVQDTGERLVTFIPPGAEFGFPGGHPLGVHPWQARGHLSWTGHGSLSIHRTGEPWQTSVFWTGPDRQFECWYIDIIRPATRFDGGVDGADHELDLVILPDGSVHEKDVELFEQEVLDGRFTQAEAVTIREHFEQVKRLVSERGVPVEPHWATWQPPQSWGPLPLPPGWQDIPVRT